MDKIIRNINLKELTGASFTTKEQNYKNSAMFLEKISKTTIRISESNTIKYVNVSKRITYFEYNTERKVLYVSHDYIYKFLNHKYNIPFNNTYYMMRKYILINLHLDIKTDIATTRLI